MRLSKRILAVCLLGSLQFFGQTVTPGTETSTTNLPPVGLAATETAQVNVVNTAPASSTGTVGACTGSITFYDTNGKMIGAAADFNVANGQTFSAKLPYASAEPTGDSRIVIRAAIAVTFNGNVAVAPVNGAVALPPPCFLASSLETFDTASGVTHVYYANAAPQVVPVLRSGQFSATLPAR